MIKAAFDEGMECRPSQTRPCGVFFFSLKAAEPVVVVCWLPSVDLPIPSGTEARTEILMISLSGWWFGTFLVLHISGNHPNWLSYFSEGQVNHQPSCVVFWFLSWQSIVTLGNGLENGWVSIQTSINRGLSIHYNRRELPDCGWSWLNLREIQ